MCTGEFWKRFGSKRVLGFGTYRGDTDLLGIYRSYRDGTTHTLTAPTTAVTTTTTTTTTSTRRHHPPPYRLPTPTTRFGGQTRNRRKGTGSREPVLLEPRYVRGPGLEVERRE